MGWLGTIMSYLYFCCFCFNMIDFLLQVIHPRRKGSLWLRRSARLCLLQVPPVQAACGGGGGGWPHFLSHRERKAREASYGTARPSPKGSAYTQPKAAVGSHRLGFSTLPDMNADILGKMSCRRRCRELRYGTGRHGWVGWGRGRKDLTHERDSLFCEPLGGGIGPRICHHNVQWPPRRLVLLRELPACSKAIFPTSLKKRTEIARRRNSYEYMEK